MELGKFGGNKLKIHLLGLFNIQKSNATRMGDRNGDKHTHTEGTKSKCENYRGITLLRTAYKLFANIIKKKD